MSQNMRDVSRSQGVLQGTSAWRVRGKRNQVEVTMFNCWGSHMMGTCSGANWGQLKVGAQRWGDLDNLALRTESW